MKKILLCAVIAVSLSVTGKLFAQPPGNAEQRAKMQQMMKQYLKDSVMLSDAMVDSVMAIKMEFQPQMRTIFMDQSLSEVEKQSKIAEVMAQVKAREIAAGLTEEQAIKIETHEKEVRAEMRNRMNNGNG